MAGLEREPRSRRAVLAAAMGGAAALAAQSIVGPAATRAADGDPLVLGHANAAALPTILNGPDFGLEINANIQAIRAVASSSTELAPAIQATHETYVGVSGQSTHG